MASSRTIVKFLGASVITQLALLISGPLVVRTVGVSGRGQIAFWYASIAFFTFLGMAGRPPAITYFVANRKRASRDLLKQLSQPLLTGLIGISIAALAWASINVYWQDQPKITLLFVTLGAFLLVSLQFSLAGLTGEHRYTAASLLQAIPALWYAIGMLVIWLAELRSINLIMGWYLSGWAIAIAISAYTIRKTAPGYTAKPNNPTNQEFKKFARSAWISNSALIDSMAIEQLAIGAFLGAHDLGLYVIGYAFESAPLLIAVAVASASIPTISETPKAAQKQVVLQVLTKGIALTLAAAILTQIIIHPATKILFGAAALPSVPVGRILIIAGIFLGLRRLGSSILTALGEPKKGNQAEIIGLVVLLVSLPIAVLSKQPEYIATSLLISGLVCWVFQLKFLQTLFRQQTPINK